VLTIHQLCTTGIIICCTKKKRGNTGTEPTHETYTYRAVKRKNSSGLCWENGYCESFNGKLRDEFLNGEIFCSLKEAQILTERWRVEYNGSRPHRSLGGEDTHRVRQSVCG